MRVLVHRVIQFQEVLNLEDIHPGFGQVPAGLTDPAVFRTVAGDLGVAVKKPLLELGLPVNE